MNIMKSKSFFIFASMMFVSGCSTVYTFYIPDCTHENEPVLVNAKFKDGHHYFFKNDVSSVRNILGDGTGGYCMASVNTKDGIAQGEFAIYYDTGNKKYSGILDRKGHVISGEYNKYSHSSYGFESMTEANMQNCQVELDRILLECVERADIANSMNKSDKVGNPAAENVNAELSKLLLYAADLRNHPNVGEVFYHDGKRIKVLQVMSNFVLAQTYDLKTIRVDSKDEYASGESLKSGEYKYVGTYSYETVSNRDLTVRRFKKVR